MKVLKHCNFEIEEAMHLHTVYIDKGEDPYSRLYLKLVLPFVTAIEAGSFIVVVTPVLTVDHKTLEECTLSNLDEIDFHSSPLPDLPFLKHIQGVNLLKVSNDDE